MKVRRFELTPQARRDVAAIRAWYRSNLGPTASAAVQRTIQKALRRFADGVELASARRDDLPEGIFRLVAKEHLVLFRTVGDKALVLRIIHGARDVSSALDSLDD